MPFSRLSVLGQTFCRAVSAAEVNARLFNSQNPPDLLKFIATTTAPDAVGDRVLAKARAKVYTLIALYIESAGASLVEYGPAIRNTCLLAVQMETDAKASVASVGPLLQLIQSPNYSADALGAEDMFNVLMKMIRVGKLSPSMKGEQRPYSPFSCLSCAGQQFGNVAVRCCMTSAYTPRSSE